MNRKTLMILAGVCLTVLGPAAHGVTFTPAWPRGVDPVNTSWQHWNAFTNPVGGPNTPDVVDYNAYGAAELRETGTPGGAILTSTGNIYSFSRVAEFQVDVPLSNVGDLTTVLVQTRTLGSPLDLDSFQLTFDDGGPQTIAPFDMGLLGSSTTGGAFPSVALDYAFVFQVPTVPPGVAVNFFAAAPSMSLDQLVVDTIVTSQADGFADVALPRSASEVPEPASALLLLSTVAVMGGRRRR